MEPADIYEEIAMYKEIAEGAAYMKAYYQAMKFAEGTSPEAYKGMFQLGLSLVGLTTIPVNTLIEKKPYWSNTPSEYNGDDHSEVELVVPANLFKE